MAIPKRKIYLRSSSTFRKPRACSLKFGLGAPPQARSAPNCRPHLAWHDTQTSSPHRRPISSAMVQLNLVVGRGRSHVRERDEVIRKLSPADRKKVEDRVRITLGRGQPKIQRTDSTSRAQLLRPPRHTDQIGVQSPDETGTDQSVHQLSVPGRLPRSHPETAAR